MIQNTNIMYVGTGERMNNYFLQMVQTGTVLEFLEG